jgi:Nuclease-related domain
MPARSSLRSRIPGQAAMIEVLATQAAISPRSRPGHIFGRSPLARETRTKYREAIGEGVVGDMLETLGPRWDVLHVVPVDGGAKEIDHLVVGPAGVFAIVTENYPGQEVKVDGDSLTVGGRQLNEIANARELGESAATLLSAAASIPVEVTPVLVIVSSTKLALRQRPEGVTVVSSRQLLHYLEKHDRTLSGADVASVSDAAERDTTWQTSPAQAQDVQQLSRDFGSLRTQVDRARRARVLWGVVGFALVAGLIWLTTAMLVQHLLRH